MYALGNPVMTLNQVSTAQEYANARELLVERHVYHRAAAVRPLGDGDPVVVYAYAGREESHV